MPVDQSLLTQQINGVAVMIYTIVLMVAVVVALFSGTCLGLKAGYEMGREDERKRRRAPKHVRAYKTPKTLPSSALPKMKQATVYTINRRNHAYQTR